jgi:hypothetical protein
MADHGKSSNSNDPPVIPKLRQILRASALHMHEPIPRFRVDMDLG